MKPTLVVLAAGMGSRYGGVKQIDRFGPSGETILDYSVYDALRAGFGKVVFIIRKEIEQDFREVFDAKLAPHIQVEYAFQTKELPFEGIVQVPEREKPWGTGHAVLCARNHIQGPFAVINADDFYGRDGFEKMAAFLSSNTDSGVHAMVGYELPKTLSEFGSVSRGICLGDADDYLTSIEEHTKVYPENGKIISEREGGKTELSPDSPVSMNFWGFMPSVFDNLETWFVDFVNRHAENPKAEYFIPLTVQSLMEQGHKVKILRNSGVWFGVTYREDREHVSQSIADLVNKGEYPAKLW
ncbi:MAG: NTP transferase domain-containing protein [Flavobacteriales bacterium]|nr:NTP transferase domain-containing protein [Flavobacteriales bacterium]